MIVGVENLQFGDIIRFEGGDGVFYFDDDGLLYVYSGGIVASECAMERLLSGEPFEKLFENERNPGDFWPKDEEEFCYINRYGNVRIMFGESSCFSEEKGLREMLVRNGVCFSNYWTAYRYRQKMAKKRRESSR